MGYILHQKHSPPALQQSAVDNVEALQLRQGMEAGMASDVAATEEFFETIHSRIYWHRVKTLQIMTMLINVVLVLLATDNIWQFCFWKKANQNETHQCLQHHQTLILMQIRGMNR
jgi:uncharacterized membrane protein